METRYKGLTEQQAKTLLQENGFNEVAATVKKRGFLAITLEAVREPMILLLLIAGVIYLFLGDAKEAAILLFFVLVIIGILIFQQQKTERVLEKLRDLTSPRALIIREGQYKRVAGREVVCGEILVLQEGDRVAADAVLLESHDLRVDESLLTGESVSVEKKSGINLSPEVNKVYLGTMVTQGQAIARVIATGSDTELGKIGKSIQEVKAQPTPLQLIIKRLVRIWALIGITLCALIVIIYYLTRHSLLGGILAGITFAMATLPEEFPLILTVFFALGAWRISKHHVLTRQLPAIETLGAMTVLCVDKTGTLTQNQMTVNCLYTNGHFLELVPTQDSALPESFHELVAYGILASELKPFDAMELAFHELGERHLKISTYLPSDRKLVHEYELTPEILAITHVWQVSNQKQYIVATKGAPETIFKLCHLSDEETQNLSEQVTKMAKGGLRLLGVAKAEYVKNNNPWPLLPSSFNFQFLGLVGLSDPIRPQAPSVVKNCQQAGIRIILMTGDYSVTALAIAKQLDIDHQGLAISGAQIESLSTLELQTIAKQYNVFTRILPRQKLKLINALKADNQVVAMTGDGVNDAPALKAAHIGIAMGKRGTDVAREASSIVLLNDDLSSIVAATRLGRRIFSNIQKAMAYIFAIHVPIAGLSLIPLLLGWPLLFFPIHIAFLQLIIDPTCGLAFEAEPEEPNTMQVPPRKISTPIFTKKMIFLSLIQGIIVLIGITLTYGLAIHLNMPTNQARALSFASLVFANLSLILTNRSWDRSFIKTLKTENKVMWWILLAAICFLTLIIYQPFFRNLFQFSALSLVQMLLCFAIGVGSVLWFEVYKWFQGNRTK